MVFLFFFLFTFCNNNVLIAIVKNKTCILVFFAMEGKAKLTIDPNVQPWRFELRSC